MPLEEADVVVVGSGAGGLTAALSAAEAGARVVVLERSEHFGGTSAISGAGIWAANNRFMAALGLSDSRAEALEYLEAAAVGRSSPGLLATLVDRVNEAIAFVEERTGIEFSGGRGADYQQQLPGAKVGRNVNPGLFDSKLLGDDGPLVRRGWTEMPITVEELGEWGGLTNKERWDWALIERRRDEGLLGLGGALIGGLLHACKEREVRLLRGRRARRLLREDGRISAVLAETAAGEETWRARRGVILASGGFEWNEQLVRRFLGVPMSAPGSPPFNEGDGLVMAMDVGAATANLADAYWGVMVSVPDDRYEGRQLHRTTTDLRGIPGSLVVNRSGSRFANESMNYNDLGKIMMYFDPVGYDYPNLPCYFIFDERFRRENVVLTLRPEDPTPPWLHESATLAELAGRLRVDADGLQDEVVSFNEFAREGLDPKFQRGGDAFDRQRGRAHGDGPNPNLRALGDGPYYGLELTLGCLGTKGGPVINEDGQVLDVYDQPMPGLYACGNVAASVLGGGYASTLGPIITFGYLAGRHAGGRVGPGNSAGREL